MFTSSTRVDIICPPFLPVPSINGIGDPAAIVSCIPSNAYVGDSSRFVPLTDNAPSLGFFGFFLNITEITVLNIVDIIAPIIILPKAVAAKAPIAGPAGGLAYKITRELLSTTKSFVSTLRPL